MLIAKWLFISIVDALFWYIPLNWYTIKSKGTKRYLNPPPSWDSQNTHIPCQQWSISNRTNRTNQTGPISIHWLTERPGDCHARHHISPCNSQLWLYTETRFRIGEYQKTVKSNKLIPVRPSKIARFSRCTENKTNPYNTKTTLVLAKLYWPWKKNVLMKWVRHIFENQRSSEKQSNKHNILYTICMGQDTNQWKVGACLKVFFSCSSRFFESRYLCEFFDQSANQKEKEKNVDVFFCFFRQTLMNQYEKVRTRFGSKDGQGQSSQKVAGVVEKIIRFICIYVYVYITIVRPNLYPLGMWCAIFSLVMCLKLKRFHKLWSLRMALPSYGYKSAEKRY